MRRRDFLGLVGGAAAWPSVAASQRTGVPLIGKLHATSAQFTDYFLQGLRETGFIEGQTVLLETRMAGGAYDRLPALAAELVDLRVNVLAAFGTAAVRAVKTVSLKSAPTIPIVFAMASDPVADGFVDSFNRPGHNMTGVTSISSLLAPKRLELMRDMLRDDAVIAMLINPDNPQSVTERRQAEVAAHAIGQRLEVLTARTSAEIDDAFAVLQTRKVSILIIAADNFYYNQMQRMAALARQAAVPAIGPLREFAVQGGLLSYGASIPDVNRQAGMLAGKILKGAQPSDLPVQQPTKFELIVNLKSAKALGVALPPKLLALADEVIE